MSTSDGKYKRIALDSRNTTNTNNSVTIVFGPATTVRALRVIAASVPFTWYTVRASDNDQMSYTVSGTEYTCTITPGVYTTTTLATEIVAQLNAIGNAPRTWTCSFSTSTFKTTLTASGAGATLTTTAGANTRAVYFYRMLGYPTTPLSPTSSTIFISTNVYNLTGENYIYITWPDTATSPQSAVGGDGINVPTTYQSTTLTFAKIPVNVSPGSIIFYDTRGDDRQPFVRFGTPLSTLRFRLERNGYLGSQYVDLNGAYWSIDLEVIYG